MKKSVFLILLSFIILLSGCDGNSGSNTTTAALNSPVDGTPSCTAHIDDDSNGVCDVCFSTV